MKTKLVMFLLLMISKPLLGNRLDYQEDRTYLCTIQNIIIEKIDNNENIAILNVSSRNLDTTGDGKSNYFELLEPDEFKEYNMENIFGTDYLINYSETKNFVRIQKYKFHYNGKNSYISNINNLSLVLFANNNFENITVEAFSSIDGLLYHREVELYCTNVDSDNNIVQKLQSKKSITPEFNNILMFMHR